MAACPASSSLNILWLNTCDTSPIPMCPFIPTPSVTAIPADSCPRCCCANNPWYVSRDASAVPHTPNSPPFSFFSYPPRSSATAAKGISARGPPATELPQDQPESPNGIPPPPPGQTPPFCPPRLTIGRRPLT